MRAPGITLHKLPLFTWAIFVTAILLLLSLPVLAGELAPAINLAVCWKLFSVYLSFFKDNQQVTCMNLMSTWNLNDCAPELLILSMFPVSSVSFSTDRSIGQGELRTPQPNIGSYLAGLIEGDGTLVVPKSERSDKGKLNYPSIQIVFGLKEFPLCQALQKLLGHGSIAKKKQSAAYILTINSLEGLTVLCNLINGLMRGPKHHQLLLLIDYLNRKSPDLHINQLPPCKTPLGSDAWLSGFIEADGSFQVRTSLTSKVPRLAVSFELSKSRVTHYGYSTLDLMKAIATALEVEVNEIRSDRKYPQYRVRTSSLKTNIKLKEYLFKYPLRGTKYMDFKD